MLDPLLASGLLVELVRADEELDHVKPPVSPGRCAQNVFGMRMEFVLRLLSLPPQLVNSSFFGAYSCQRVCEENASCAGWAAWMEWRVPDEESILEADPTDRLHSPALVCKHVSGKAWQNLYDQEGNTNATFSTFTTSSENGAPRRPVGANHMKLGICEDFDPNADVVLAAKARGPATDANRPAATDVADKLACRARRKRILHKQGFSRPQVSRILEQIQAVEEEHAADKDKQRSRVTAGDDNDNDNQHHDSETREQNSLGVEDEDGNGTSTTTAVVGGSTSSARVRDLMRILEGMEHEYTFEQYVEAMTTGIPEGLGFSDAYAREVASVLMTFEGQTDERDEDEVPDWMDDSDADGDGDVPAEVEPSEGLDPAGPLADSEERAGLLRGSLEDGSGIFSDELPRVAVEAPATRPDSDNPPADGPEQPDSQAVVRKLRKTRSRDRARDVQTMVGTWGLSVQLAKAYGDLLNGEDLGARELLRPLPLPASDAEMAAVRRILGAEEGAELAPTVKEFKNALRGARS
eukprot:g12952.t1